MKYPGLQKFNKFTIYLILFLFTFPSLIWILLDQSVWPHDQSTNARGALELYYAIHSPADWLRSMIRAYGIWAPAIGWFGQFFVPLGKLLGSTEVGFLLSVFVTQFLILILTFNAINELAKNRKIIAIVAALVVGATPQFVALSHEFFVEPIQTLAVSWFILIMSFSPKWDKRFILAQLINASSFAMLAKLGTGVV